MGRPENNRHVDGKRQRRCTICNRWMLLTKTFFPVNRSRGYAGFAYQCKECKNRAARERRIRRLDREGSMAGDMPIQRRERGALPQLSDNWERLIFGG
jgi:uncharacterized protein YlaI